MKDEGCSHIPTVCALDIQFPDMGSRLNCPCPICPCSDPLATGQGPSFVIMPQGPQVAMRCSKRELRGGTVREESAVTFCFVLFFSSQRHLT
jgi:hypothetical protein